MLNKEQRKAVDCKDSLVLINASAGTGKTTTLVEAAREHINNHNPNTVVITFTNAAADELKQKITQDCLFIGTIHRFAIKVIYELAAQYQFRVNFLNKDQIESIVYRLLKDNDMELTNFEFRKYLFYLTNKKAFLEQYDSVPTYYEKVEQEYRKFKKKIQAFDYTDAPEYLVLKLEEHEWTTQYDGLFVDEAQDLSPDQYIICSKMKAKKKFIIGDPRQSIYLFRGAAPEIFYQFKHDGYTYFTLPRNYRSYQEILDYAETGLIADRGKGGIIYDDITAIMEHSPQILCRTNKEVNAIKEYYSNVSTVHKAKGLEYDNVIVVDFPLKTKEDKNIRFVALTRARNGLLVTNFSEIYQYVQVHPNFSETFFF